MTSTKKIPGTGGETSTREITWQVWPLRDGAPRTGLVLLGLGIGLALIQWSVASWVLSLLAAGAMATTIWRFFLPVRFTLGPTGMTQQVFGSQRKVAWKSIGSYEIRRQGVLLFRVNQRFPLDAFRGLYVAWGPYRSEVVTLVKHYLGEAKLTGFSSFRAPAGSRESTASRSRK